MRSLSRSVTRSRNPYALVAYSRAQRRLPEIAARCGQTGISHRETLIEFNRSLQERHARSISFLAPDCDTHTIIFQGLEGGGCGLNRNVEFLDRGQRFSQPGPKTEIGRASCSLRV